MVQGEAELRVAGTGDQRQSVDEPDRGFAEARDLPVVALIGVVINVAVRYRRRHGCIEPGAGAGVEGAVDAVCGDAIECLKQPVDVRVIELFDADFLRELPEHARRPLHAGIGVARLQAKLLRPGALIVGHGVRRRVVRESGRHVNAPPVLQRIPRAGLGRRRRCRTATEGGRLIIKRVRPAERLKVSEVEARSLVRVGLVAVVVRAVRDEGHVREIDLHLERRQVVLIGNRDEFGRRVVESARSRIGVGRPVRR